MNLSFVSPSFESGNNEKRNALKWFQRTHATQDEWEKCILFPNERHQFFDGRKSNQQDVRGTLLHCGGAKCFLSFPFWGSRHKEHKIDTNKEFKSHLHNASHSAEFRASERHTQRLWVDVTEHCTKRCLQNPEGVDLCDPTRTTKKVCKETKKKQKTKQKKNQNIVLRRPLWLFAWFLEN